MLVPVKTRIAVAAAAVVEASTFALPKREMHRDGAPGWIVTRRRMDDTPERDNMDSSAASVRNSCRVLFRGGLEGGDDAYVDTNGDLENLPPTLSRADGRGIRQPIQDDRLILLRRFEAYILLSNETA